MFRRYDSGVQLFLEKWKNRAVSNTFKKCTSCVLSHSGDIVWHKNWTQDLTATGLDHHDLRIQTDVSKHGFKIMGMIRGMIRGYDSGAWFGVWFEEMQHACGHRFCICHFWKHSCIRAEFYLVLQVSIAGDISSHHGTKFNKCHTSKEHKLSTSSQAKVHKPCCCHSELCPQQLLSPACFAVFQPALSQLQQLQAPQVACAKRFKRYPPTWYHTMHTMPELSQVYVYFPTSKYIEHIKIKKKNHSCAKIQYIHIIIPFEVLYNYLRWRMNILCTLVALVPVVQLTNQTIKPGGLKSSFAEAQSLACVDPCGAWINGAVWVSHRS